MSQKFLFSFLFYLFIYFFWLIQVYFGNFNSLNQFQLTNTLTKTKNQRLFLSLRNALDGAL